MAISSKKVYLMVCDQTDGQNRQAWLNQLPELSIITEIEPVFIFNQPSADISPQNWQKLAEAIYERLNKAKGFVIFHGLDNLLYTSSALSFLLQNLSRPVIFTSGQLKSPLAQNVEIKANLINACQAINYDIKEVSLMFGNRLLRANIASKGQRESSNIFTTPPNGILGRIDFSIRIFDEIPNNKIVTKYYDRLNDKIAVLEISPFLNKEFLIHLLAGKEGLVINAGPYQNLPPQLLSLLAQVAPSLPTVIWLNHSSDLALPPKNLLVIDNLTWPATVTKFMWALGQTNNHRKVKELMAKNLAGEILVPAA
jgi:L-asparaginase